MEKLELIREIIELQRKVDRARRQYELDVWMALPLTIAQLKSLFFISNQGSTNLGKLAAALGVTPTNTTGIVDRLVKQGSGEPHRECPRPPYAVTSSYRQRGTTRG